METSEQSNAGTGPSAKDEWVLRRYADTGLYGCVRVHSEPGKDNETTGDTGPMAPDFHGEDVDAIVAFCDRFHFTVGPMVDECRRAVSRIMAEQKAADLNRFLAENGGTTQITK